MEWEGQSYHLPVLHIQVRSQAVDRQKEPGQRLSFPRTPHALDFYLQPSTGFPFPCKSLPLPGQRPPPPLPSSLTACSSSLSPALSNPLHLVDTNMGLSLPWPDSSPCTSWSFALHFSGSIFTDNPIQSIPLWSLPLPSSVRILPFESVR